MGKWAEPIQNELSDLLEKEFSLPYFMGSGPRVEWRYAWHTIVPFFAVNVLDPDRVNEHVK